MASIKKSRVSVIFDRRKKAGTTGVGMVEIRIKAEENKYRYITISSCSAIQWVKYQKGRDLKVLVNQYESKLYEAESRGATLTLENINILLGLTTSQESPKEKTIDKNGFADGSFLDFLEAEIKKEEGMAQGTKAKRITLLKGLQAYKKLKKFSDITPAGIRAFDEWLRQPFEDHRRDLDKNGERIKRKKPILSLRSDAGVHNYHKTLRVFIKKAIEQELIPKDPYTVVHFPKGKAKERKPLIESELIKLREMKLTGHLDRARDIFVFCAYTGLAYVDAMNFEYDNMVDHLNGIDYIDGERVKTGSQFYTPILPPALQVLKKYDYELPYMSCQKLNDYLHVIEARLELHKPMTSHVARHSFATLNVQKDTPLKRLQKMMGHKHEKTTEIYTHLASTLVTEQASKLIASLL